MKLQPIFSWKSNFSTWTSILEFTNFRQSIGLKSKGTGNLSTSFFNIKLKAVKCKLLDLSTLSVLEVVYIDYDLQGLNVRVYKMLWSISSKWGSTIEDFVSAGRDVHLGFPYWNRTFTLHVCYQYVMCMSCVYQTVYDINTYISYTDRTYILS